MAVPQLLPPGKAVRFWTRLEDLPPIFFGPIAREIGLCWLSYDKDGSVYTGARFTASEIDSPAGLLAGEDMTVQKISIHGSGKILGPDRHLESARRTEDHLGFPIIGLTHRAQICKHLVGNAGTYITAFDTRTHRRPTDLFLKGVLEEHGLFVLSIEVAPAGSNISEDQAAWTTKPLVNGEPMLIIANLAFYAEEVRPDAHQILAPRG